MGKKKKQLSQAEIWDDSALIQSWDDALEEYRLYHSIHARGERVDDVLKEAEAGDNWAGMEGRNVDRDSLAIAPQMDETHQTDLEEGEVEDEHIMNRKNVESLGDGAKETLFPNGSVQEKPSSQSNADATVQLPGTSGTPNMLVGNIQNEALKNLMMSWYYAGYYTGLYEGQQNPVKN